MYTSLKAVDWSFELIVGVDAAVGEVHFDDVVDDLIFAQQGEPCPAEADRVLGVAELRIAGGVLAEVRHVELDAAAGGNQRLGRRLALGVGGRLGVVGQLLLQIAHAFGQVVVRGRSRRRQCTKVGGAIFAAGRLVSHRRHRRLVDRITYGITLIARWITLVFLRRQTTGRRDQRGGQREVSMNARPYMVLFLREKNRPDALIGNMPPFPDKCHRIGKYVNFVRMVTNGITASRPGVSSVKPA